MEAENLTAELIKHYTMIARLYCKSDPDLAKAILSDICIKALESKKTKISDLKYTAKSWAIDFLRSRRHNYSYGNIFKHISIEAMAEAGIQIDTDYNVLLPRNFRKLEVGNEVMELFS